MYKVLFLLPAQQWDGAARQVAMWTAGLSRHGVQSCVAVLGPDGACGQALRDAGVAVEVLGQPRLFHLAVLPRLFRLTQSWGPHIIHTWGAAALRLATVALWARGAPAVRLIASAPLGDGRPAAGAGRLDRLWLGQAYRVCATGAAQAARLLRAGVPAPRLVVLPAWIAGWEPAPAAGDDVRQVLGLAAGTPLVACAGPLERAGGFKEAIWAFNILAQVAGDLHLLLIGAGPDRPLLEHHAHASGTGRVHFLPPPPGNVGRLLAQVDVVWVPRANDTGASTVFEAMAVGRPVVASRSPELAELVVDGQTGLLCAAGDKADLARQTLGLLRNPELRRRYGEAGRKRVRWEFAADDQVRRLARLYESAIRDEAELPTPSAPGALPGRAA
jgi:glycosyltransferase involved in cell wall biosynthesis